jgi:uncharacterized membrane protein
MEAKLLGHPIHQSLIVFPVGLLLTSVVFDVIHLATGGAQWSLVSFWMIAAGVIGGLAAALFGLIDYLGIPSRTRAKRIAVLHGLGNVAVVGLFALSWFLRRPSPEAPATTALVCSFLGGAVVLCTAWLGGELVDRLGVGVDEKANVDAPSSLSRRSA